MVGLVVMPVAVGDICYVLYKSGIPSWRTQEQNWRALQETKIIATGIGLIGSGVAVFCPPLGAGMMIGAGVGLL